MQPGSEVSVRVSELRQALLRVLAAIERERGPEVDLGADYYWAMPDALLYGYAPPRPDDMTAGQLSDDISSLRELLAQPDDEPVFVAHELRHLVPLLVRLGAQDAERG